MKIKSLLVLIACILLSFLAYKKISFNIFDNFNESNDVVKRVDMNDFLVELIPLKTEKIPASKTASIRLKNSSSNELLVMEQRYDISKIWSEYNLHTIFSEFVPFLEFNGGIKQSFIFEGNEFIFVTLKAKSSDQCYLTSLINLTLKVEVFRTPCIAKTSLPDFNGIGGGYAIRNDLFYFAVGAPEYTSSSVRKMALDSRTPYGKVIYFNKERLLSKPTDIFQFNIYTMGHRNPQGMVVLDGELFEVEHGPKGGDEINLLIKGGNYGWPKYSLGSPYQSENEQAYKVASSDTYFRSPLYAFIPSIGSSDITTCPSSISDRYSPLGCLLVSSLRAQSIFVVLFVKKSHAVISVEKVSVGMRIREFARNSRDRVIFSVDDAPKGTSGIYEMTFSRVYP